MISGRLRLRKLRLPESEAQEPLAPPGDGELLPLGGQVEVVAEAVAELVGADGDRRFGMELGGLEPPTPCMPCRCSGQLSYSPVELVLLCKVNARSLTVFRRLEPQVKRPLPNEQRLREKVATVKVTGVDREQLNFTAPVSRPDVTARRASVGLDSDHDHAAFTVQAAPLALDPEEVVADLQDEVRATVFADRLEHGDARPFSRECDLQFGDVALHVRVLDHEHMFPCEADGLLSLMAPNG